VPPFAVKEIVLPTQTVLPTALATGLVFTITFAVVLAVQPLAFVTVTEYIPAMAVVELAIVRFCKVDVKVFGPLQL
jgi:hypothetical protein